jgi:alkanesulfonate monooxygenase SsuD/methylene tetrahydromethanopterin reductase-like flavin-dependent oxidoreductase (luciferase family)
VICADTDAEARHLLTSLQNVVIGLVTGSPGRLAPPAAPPSLPPPLQARADAFLACTFAGAPSTVRAGLESFLAATQADELIVASAIFDPAARMHSAQLLAQACL